MKKIGEQKKNLSAKSLIEKTGVHSSSNMDNGQTDVERTGRERHDRRGMKRSRSDGIRKINAER